MSVHLITGDDPILVGRAVSKLVGELLGDSDRELALTQINEDDLRQPEGGWNLAALVDAAQTPPLISDKRVIVGRHLARFSRADDYKALVAVLKDMPPTTDLVLVWERGQKPPMEGRMPRLPKALTAAVRAAGGKEVKTASPTGKQKGAAWVKDQIADSGLRFNKAAVNSLVELVGEDRSLVVGYLRTLEGALGSKAAVTASDVAVYGGDPGSVAPWDLDDAIDRGDVKAALETLHRILSSRHPFQVLAALHGRYQRMLRLDGSGVTNERQAAEILGMKGSTFPARKLLNQSRRLGPQKVARVIRLLAEADLAMRGTIDWPDELVMEVLVARMAAMTAR